MTTFADLVPSPAGRFDGIERPYSVEDVLKLRGSVTVAQTLAERGANRLWELLHSEPYINALGAVTGNQAMQMVRADRRRRRGRVRRAAEQLRDHEGLHRGGCRGRPFRGPAGQ